jgi:hypothetical protein
MNEAITRPLSFLGAVAVLCVLAAPTVASGASGDGEPGASASGKVNKKIKKLNQRLNALQAQVDGIALQPGPQGPGGEKGDKGDPGAPGLSTGPAGGDLTGSYPNPSIASDVLAPFIEGADGVPGGDLTGTYANPELKPGTVGTSETGTIPAVRVFNTANQNIPSSTVTALSFDSEQFDTAGLHSTSTNPDRLTAPVDGIYQVNGWIQLAFGGTIDGASLSAIILASNGSRVAESEAINPATNTVLNLSGLLRLNAGDSVQLNVATDNSTPAAALGNATAGLPAFSMAWVGPPPGP